MTFRGLVDPRYGSGSLAEVLPSALAALDVSGWQNVHRLPEASSYVVFLIDGLGWNLLRSHADDAPYMSSLASAEGSASRPITCGVPSTTATSLTSLGTGLSPGSHGIAGFTTRIPGTSRLLDALRWDSRVDPLTWQPAPPVFERAAEQGVPVSVVGRRSFERSGLTQASQRGASYVGADYAGERIAATAALACIPGSLTYVYEGDLDGTGHRSGCDSLAWRYQLQEVDHFAEVLRSRLPSEAALVIVADHGMLDVPFASRVDVDDEPELMRGVALFGGEARLRHLYCAEGVAVDDVAARWRDRLGPAALVLPRADAVERGWFGAVASHVLPRIGDVIVASVEDVAVVSRTRFPLEQALIGLHGSLTADEMLVPLLIDAP